MKRNEKIIRISFKSIITNVFLVIFKVIVGSLASSTAIILDGLNNLSDTLSSTATIIGIRLSSKAADKEHPYGHGRIEYFTTLIVSLIVLAAGISALIEAISKIRNPITPNYSALTIIIIIIAIITKIILGSYVKRKGKELDSDTLIAQGNDALFDSILSSSTLIAVLVFLIGNINLEGYISFFIACFIIKNAIEMIKDPINDIIGIRINDDLKEKIRNDINKFEDVHGVYDLMLHNYGPFILIGSVHIEVDDKMTAKDIHKLSKDIEKKIFKKYEIILTIGIYASNNTSKMANKTRNDIENIINKYDTIRELHGLYIDEKNKYISFDLIFDFKEKNIEEVKNDIINKLKDEYPNYKIEIVIDKDV